MQYVINCHSEGCSTLTPSNILGIDAMEQSLDLQLLCHSYDKVWLFWFSAAVHVTQNYDEVKFGVWAALDVAQASKQHSVAYRCWMHSPPSTVAPTIRHILCSNNIRVTSYTTHNDYTSHICVCKVNLKYRAYCER